MTGSGHPTIDLDRLYAGVEDDAALAELPDALAAACGGRSGMLLHTTAAGHSLALMNYWPVEPCARYFAEFTGADPWVDACRVHGLDDGRVFAADRLLPPDRFAATPIYNELIRPLGDDTGRCLGMVWVRGDARMQIGIHRAGADRPWSDAEIAALAGARDHVVRLMELRALLDTERGARRRIEAMLDATNRAVLLLDRRLRIVHATPAAAAILAQGDGIASRRGQLAPGATRVAAELSRLIAASIADRPEPRAALLCPRPSGRSPYRLRILPPGRRAPGHALVVLDDPERAPGDGISAFAAAYGLSAAECRIAEGLAAGATLDELAAERQVARETIRTQLKHLFARTGVSRQSDLIRLFAHLPDAPRG